MKVLTKKLLLIVAVCGVFGSLNAWAANEPISGTARAIQAVVDKFKTEEAGSAAGFQGVKAWPDGADHYQIKVYLPQNQTLSYSCFEHVMNGQTMMMCEKN